MTARILAFPQRSPFAVHIAREDGAWLVICRAHGWLFGSRGEALVNARELAHGFGVPVNTRPEAMP